MADEDTTKDLYGTQPTIQTVLERLNSLEQAFNTRIDELGTGLNIRLDRIESEVKLVHSQTLSLRADLTELRNQLKIPA